MKFLTLCVLSIFLGLMFVSLFQVSETMDPVQGMSDCLFMTHEAGVPCLMSVMDHMSAWKAFFATVAPLIVTVLLSVGVLGHCGTGLSKLYQILVSSRARLFKNLQQNHPPAHSVRILQEFFARGIVHPKVYR